MEDVYAIIAYQALKEAGYFREEVIRLNQVANRPKIVIPVSQE